MLRKTLIGLALLLAAAAPASAAPELSVSDRLDDRRYAAIGTRAYSVGTEAGRFPAMGFHTRGEMGGIWTPPLKLLDGLWFAVDGQPVGPATRFSSGYGYVTMDLPAPAGLQLRRTEFAPDHLTGAAGGPRAAGPGAARTVTVSVDAHSELMSAYPWGESTPSQLDFNLPDSAAADRGRLLFREQGRPPVPNAEVHDWAAVVGASRAASAIETGAGFRGPQEPPVVCGPSGEGQPEPPPRCDDTAYGKGAGGRLEYRLNVPAGGTRTLWIAVAGSEDGAAGARREADAALADPAKLLRRKVAAARGAGRASPASACRATRCSPAASTGPSRTWPTRFSSPRISRSARPTRASATRRPRAASTRCASWAPAGPTTSGCSPPTASTRPTRAWRWASSSR